MTNYSKGKIYKIVSDNIDDVYIGSTVQKLNRRLKDHKSDYKNRKITHPCSSHIIIEASDYKIELIENFPCDTKWELLQREQYYKENTPKCINKMNAISKNKCPSHSTYELCIFCDCDIRKRHIRDHNQTKKHIENKKFFDNLMEKFT